MTPGSMTNPVFDHASGAKTTVSSTSVTIGTPPARCTFAYIGTNETILIRTDGETAADAAGALPVTSPGDWYPVIPGVAVKAIRASADATVYFVPAKVR